MYNEFFKAVIENESISPVEKAALINAVYEAGRTYGVKLMENNADARRERIAMRKAMYNMRAAGYPDSVVNMTAERGEMDGRIAAIG